MPMNKPHLEFHRLDLDSGWETMAGYPSSIKQKILASDLDESRKMEAGRVCCVSMPAHSRRHHLFTIIGKRSICSREIWPWAVTSRVGRRIVQVTDLRLSSAGGIAWALQFQTGLYVVRDSLLRREQTVEVAPRPALDCYRPGAML